MPKQLAVSVRSDHTLIGVFEDGLLIDLFIDRPDQESTVGNIYVGKVTRILSNIQAAFVDIGSQKDGFLPGDDAFAGARPKSRKQQRPLEDRLKVGQLILVQVEKDEIADKGKKLTMDLSLPGRFVVFLPYHKKINVSKRIDDEKERQRLIQMVKEAAGTAEGGWIIRTVTEGVARKELQRDVKQLLKIWNHLISEVKHAKKPMLIHQELSPIEQVIRDHYSDDYNRVLVDNYRIRQVVEGFLRSISPRRIIPRRFTEYIEPDLLLETYDFKRQLQRALDRKVWLPCGGYLIIEETETLTAIDVNTGKNIRGNEQSETILKTNIEAAEEIGRQLRLRGIGGIIVVDFIDLKTAKDYQKVMDVLKKSLASDKAAFDITSFSDIGLVQITRQRTGESLINILSEECSHCHGNGRILTLHGN